MLFDVKNLSFQYGKKLILQDINFNIKDGEIISLLGQNGAGKSTLMKLILGLLSPASGRINLYGKNIKLYSQKELAKLIAYVPQSTNIAFAYSALDIVLMGRISWQSFFSSHSKNDIQIALNSLIRLNAEHLAKEPFQNLSGGEKQKVLIARAIAQEAKIFVMDEPVSGLDYGNQIRLLETILDLQKDGYTFLKSTHFPEHAIALGGRTIAIKGGQIIVDGATDKAVTSELIYELYGVKVSLDKLKSNKSVKI